MTLNRIANHAGIAAFGSLVVTLSLLFGGYHPRHWVWAAAILLVAACAITVYGGLTSMSSAAGRAMQAGIVLVIWTGASWLWADYSHHLVWDETNRTVMYVATFMLGTALAGSIRTYLAATRWMLGAIAIVGVVTTLKLASGDNPATMFVAGRLEYPLGYTNGTAAFFAVGLWLAIGMSAAAERQLLRRHQQMTDPSVRYDDLKPKDVESAVIPELSTRYPFLMFAQSGLALAAATLFFALFILTQSRGGILAAIASIVVMMTLVPNRIALMSRLLIVGVASIVIKGALSDPYTLLISARNKAIEKTADASTAASAANEALSHAGTWIMVVTLLTCALGALLAYGESEFTKRRGSQQLSDNVRLTGAIVLALACGIGLAFGAARDTTPTEWISQQVSACKNPPNASTANAASHFSDVGTNRCDFWKVSINIFKAHPFIGIGANNFQGAYAKTRTSNELPKQAHSLPMQIIGDLGIVGLLLFAVILRSILIATHKYIGSGRWRDPTVAGAIAAIAYWSFHTSVDWLWNLPAVTLPVIFLSGGLVMCISPANRRAWSKAAVPAALGAMVVGLAMLIPQAIADNSYRTARDPKLHATNPQQALDAANRAATWDPTWGAPKVYEAQLLAAAGTQEAALAALQDAINREPNSWSVHSSAAQAYKLLAERSKIPAQKKNLLASAVNSFRKALVLNPKLATSTVALEFEPLLNPIRKVTKSR